MKKRILSVILALCLVFSLLPVSAFADSAPKSGFYTKNGEENTFSWELDDAGTLTISGKGTMWGTYTSNDFTVPWEAYLNDIRSVVIQEGIEGIGEKAFRNCVNLESVSLPSSLKYIYGSAFCNTGIESIVLPENLTLIGGHAFEQSKLKSITFPDSLKSIGNWAFASCDGLTDIVIPDSVKSVGAVFDAYVFYGCKNLKTVVIGEGVTDLGENIFSGCESLEKVTLSEGIETIWGYAFGGCTSLESIELPNSLKAIYEHAFYDCRLTDIKFPDGLISIGDNAFRDSTFKNVKLPSALKYVGDYAFLNSSFDSVTISKDMQIGYSAFGFDVGSYTVDENNKIIKMIDGIIWNVDEKDILCCDRSKCAEGYVIKGASKIGSYAFANCTNLKEIFFIGWAPYISENAFLNCSLTIDYPRGEETWNSTANLNYGGKIKWVSYSAEVPSAPKLSVSADSATGKPALKWNADENAVGYIVYRATSKYGDYYYMDSVTETKYVDNKAVPGTTYYYVVTAVNVNSEESDVSNIKYITCDCARPVVTISTNASTGSPSLKWKAVTGATKYEIYRATSKNGTYTKMYTTTSTSYSNTSATVGTTYYYKVKAICGKSSYGNSAYSTVKSIKCAPAAPSLSISRSNGKPKLSWKSVSGATKYWIYRSTDGKNFKYYDSTTKTSYTNTGAASGTKYYYKVKAVKVVNGNNVASAYSYAKSLVCTPTTPNVSITSASGKPKLSWNAVNGATKYWIYRSTDGKNFKYYDSTTKTTYTNSSTTVGTKYYYKVKSVVADNGTSYTSDFSSAKSLLVSTAAPVVKVAAAEGTPSLSWNAVNGAEKYWVYRSTDGVNFKYYDTTTKTTYTNKSVTAGTTYYYKVKAVKVVNGSSIASQFSNSVSVKA